MRRFWLVSFVVVDPSHRSGRQRRGRLALVFLVLAVPLLGCIDCDGPPGVSRCDTPDAETDVAIDSLRFVDIETRAGGQGIEMWLMSIEWIGERPPECAFVRVRIVDASGATLRDLDTFRVPTEDSPRGRITTGDPPWIGATTEADGDALEIESYGQTAHYPLCDLGWCADPRDGGP